MNVNALFSELQKESEEKYLYDELIKQNLINSEFQLIYKTIKIVKLNKTTTNLTKVTFLEKDGSKHSVTTNKSIDYLKSFLDKKVVVIGAQTNTAFWIISSIYDISHRLDDFDNCPHMSENDIKDLENKIASFPIEKQKEIVNTVISLSDIEPVEDSTIIDYCSIEELDLMFSHYKKIMPPQIVSQYEHCKHLHTHGTNDQKKHAYNIMQEIINYRWIPKKELQIDSPSFTKALSNKHISYSRQFQIISEELLASSKNETFTKPFIFVSSKRIDSSSFAIDMAKELGLPYEKINYSGFAYTDTDGLFGSSPIYDNGKAGDLFHSIKRAEGNGILILQDYDQYSTELKTALREIILYKRYTDQYLNVPFPLDQMIIVVTCEFVEDIPLEIRDNCLEISFPDPTEKDFITSINKVLLPDICKNFHLNLTQVPDYKAVTKIIYQYGQLNLRKIRSVLHSVAVKAISRKETEFPYLTLDNLDDYYSINMNLMDLKSKHVTSVYELESKFFNFYGLYPEENKNKILKTLDKVHREKDPLQKSYYTTVLTTLINIYDEKPETYQDKTVIKQLEKTHSGQEKLGLLLEKQLTGNECNKPICLYGAPGVGKTSIAQSCAKAVNRPFIKLNLGGVTTSAFFHGKPRHAPNAEPSQILKELSKSGHGNYHAIIFFDELDKMEPSAFQALYELLDPTSETFYDHYLDTNIPKKNFTFIVAANDLGKIPAPVLDRMLLIKCEGYSLKEKKEIIMNHSIPNLIKNHGLEKFIFPDNLLDTFVRHYVTNAGVRDAEKGLELLYLHKTLNTDSNTIEIQECDLIQTLGIKTDTKDSLIPQPGTVNALGVNQYGGSCFQVETVIPPHSTEPLKITGMPVGSCLESINVATTLTGIYTNAPLPNLHIHFTDAGIQKDGPSAGLSIFMSIMSLLHHKDLSAYGFTGEITLSKRVLPVGGIKDKITAAERSGLKAIYISKHNLEELKAADSLKKYDIQIYGVSHLDELVQTLFSSF